MQGKAQEISFNSTLVQLKVSIHKQINVRIHSFNSTLVQLKEIENTGNGELLKMFQFYLSSIKSDIINDKEKEGEQVSILP